MVWSRVANIEVGLKEAALDLEPRQHLDLILCLSPEGGACVLAECEVMTVTP